MEFKTYKPLFNKLLVTADVYTEEDVEKNISEIGVVKITEDVGQVKPYQKIVFLGDTCNKNLKEDQVVLINPSRYIKMVQQEKSAVYGQSVKSVPIIVFEEVIVDGNKYIELWDNDIRGIINE